MVKNPKLIISIRLEGYSKIYCYSRRDINGHKIHLKKYKMLKK